MLYAFKFYLNKLQKIQFILKDHKFGYYSLKTEKPSVKAYFFLIDKNQRYPTKITYFNLV